MNSDQGVWKSHFDTRSKQDPTWRETIADGEYFYWLNEQDAYESCPKNHDMPVKKEGYVYKA